MQNFTNDWMPYINFFITLITGVVLGLIIKHKNSLISTLTKNFESAKQMLELYDANTFKAYAELREETLRLEHQKEVREVIQKTTNSTLDGIEDSVMNKMTPWLEKYSELLTFHIAFLADTSEEITEKHLEQIPRNKEIILDYLKKVKESKKDNQV